MDTCKMCDKHHAIISNATRPADKDTAKTLLDIRQRNAEKALLLMKSDLEESQMPAGTLLQYV